MFGLNMTPPVNVHIVARGIPGLFDSVVHWIAASLHEQGYTIDLWRPPQVRIGIFAHECAAEWIAESNTASALATKVPYIAVATEQPRHYTYATQANRQWFENAAAIWCMDTVDMRFIHELYGIPMERMCVLPCMLATYADGVPCPADAPAPTAIVHMGYMNAHRRAVVDDIKTRLVDAAVDDAAVLHTPGPVPAPPPPRPLHVLEFETLFAEPARSQMLHGARVLVIPNFYAPPCVLTWHRTAYALHVRHAQLRIVAEECAESEVGARLLAALAPMLRVVPKDALSEAAVAAALEPDWTVDECAAHAAQLARVFAHILAPMRCDAPPLSWLP
jgi:hypothetical protein